MRPIFLVLFLVALAACSESPRGGSDAGADLPDADAPDRGPAPCQAGQRRAGEEGTCVEVGWTECGQGFVADPSGWGCAPVMPEAACPSGSFARLGDSECQAVGVGRCPDGFTLDESEFGCAPILPAAACAGATREALGSVDCAPLGDCAAAFPPAEATLFVDDSYTAAQLDATHFATLTEALAAAADGATIAVEEGRYAESLAIARAVKLVGRCAEKVVLAGALDGESGLRTSSPLRVSGFTLQGFDYALVAEYGALVEVEDCLLEGNRNIAVVAQDSGTAVALRRSAVRGTLCDSGGKAGIGAAAIFGGALTVEDSAVVSNRTAGLYSQETGSRLIATRTVVSGTQTNTSGRWGYGVQVMDGPEATLESCAVLGGKMAGLAVLAAKATVKGTTISGTAMGSDSSGQKIGAAVINQSGELSLETSTFSTTAEHGLYLSPSSTTTLTNCVVRDVRVAQAGGKGIGVAVAESSTLQASGLAVLENHGFGMIVQGGATATLSDVVVQGTLPVAGLPATGYGISVVQASGLVATNLALLGNAAASLSVTMGSTAEVDGLIVSKTQVAQMVDDPDSRYGAGIRLVASELTLKRALIERSVGVGVLVDSEGARASVSDTLVRDTGLTEDGLRGLGVVVQDKGELVMERSGIVGCRAGGLWSLSGAKTTLTDAQISGTRLDTTGQYGEGLVQTEGTSTLANVVLRDNAGAGLVGIGGATLTASNSLVQGAGLEVDGLFAQGVALAEGAVAWLSDVTIEEHQDVGLLVLGAAASVAGCRIERNGAGVNVAGGSTLSEEAEQPATLSAGEVVVTSDTVFRENSVRVGNGVVAMPPAPTF